MDKCVCAVGACCCCAVAFFGWELLFGFLVLVGLASAGHDFHISEDLEPIKPPQQISRPTPPQRDDQTRSSLSIFSPVDPNNHEQVKSLCVGMVSVYTV